MGRIRRDRTDEHAIETTPKHVLQVFRSITRFSKSEWRHPLREDALRWPEAVESDSGRVAGEAIAIPDSLANRQAALERSTVVALTDCVQRQAPWATEHCEPQHFLQVNVRAAAPYELFTLQWSGEHLELWLAWTRGMASEMRPKRNDFKLADLNPGATLRFRINGKYVHGATTYIEWDYVIQHLGLFERFVLVSPGQLRLRKPIPQNAPKQIDLRERLY
jgi:hypothetical protein